MTLKKPSSMTDRQLRECLASLREDVAAPADFRFKVMQRLRAEGLIQGQPVPLAVAQPTFWQRISRQLTPLRAGLVASALLALVLVYRRTPAPMISEPLKAVAVPPAPVAAAVLTRALHKARPVSPAQVSGGDLAVLPKPKPSTLPDALLDESQPATVGVGSSDAAAPQSAMQMGAAGSSGSAPGQQSSSGAGVPLPGHGNASAAAVSKPTVVVVEPTATPMTKALLGPSELRGNVIRASRGEAATFLYNVPEAGHVHIEVFDRLGRSVTVLKDADQAPGTYELRWAGQDDQGGLAPSGIYVLRFQAPQVTAQHKLLLVK